MTNKTYELVGTQNTSRNGPYITLHRTEKGFNRELTFDGWKVLRGTEALTTDEIPSSEQEYSYWPYLALNFTGVTETEAINNPKKKGDNVSAVGILTPEDAPTGSLVIKVVAELTQSQSWDVSGGGKYRLD